MVNPSTTCSLVKAVRKTTEKIGVASFVFATNSLPFATVFSAQLVKVLEKELEQNSSQIIEEKFVPREV